MTPNPAVSPRTPAAVSFAHFPTTSLRSATFGAIRAPLALAALLLASAIPSVSGEPVTVDAPSVGQTLAEYDSAGSVTASQADSAASDTAATSDSVAFPIGTSGEMRASRKVVVRGRRQPLRDARVRMQQVHDIPTMAGEPDVMRAILQQPSVAGSSDWSNKLYVRGGGADQNLVLFDDAILWSPSHFGGMLSTFVTDGLSDMVFHPGGFEPRYGDRLASVLEVHTRGGEEIRDTCCVDGIFRWSTFAFSLEMERRFGPWWVQGAGRYTYFDRMFAALRGLGWSDLKLDYRFYDIQSGAGWSDGHDTVRASVYAGRDQMDMAPVWIDWGNYAVPVNWSIAIDDEFRQRGGASWSWFDQNYKVNDLSSKGNSIRSLHARQELVWTPDLPHVFTLGYEGTFLSSRLTSNDLIYDRVQSSRPEAWIHEGYLQDQWPLGSGWSLSSGLRAGYATELDFRALDPRATLSWVPEPSWRFDLHGGLYTQYVTSLRFDESEQPNEFWIPLLPPAKASRQILWAVSGERSRLPWDLRVRTDFYAKDLRDIPFYFPNRTTLEDSLLGGDWFGRKLEMLHGWATGTELTLARDRGVFTGSLSYSWGMSVLYQPDFQTDGQTYSFPARWAPWDQRHRVKAQASLAWLGSDDGTVWRTVKKMKLRSGANLSWSTGMARTDVLGWMPAASPGQGGGPGGSWDDDNAWLVHGGTMQSHKDDYFRLDLTPLDFARGPERWTWSMLNVTGEKNPILQTWDATRTPPASKSINGYPFFPVMFSYEREF